MMRGWLEHPATRGLSLDDPLTTERRRDIILQKGFLRRIYEEWYGQIREALPTNSGAVVEVGSGGGFLEKLIPDVITSDINRVTGLDLVLDATALPFRAQSLRAIVMVNTFHHIPQPRRFLSEARRCLRVGGRMICVEPWYSPWATFVMKSFHHEPFEPAADAWEFESSRPLGDANGALPWIVFERDRAVFQAEFPEFEVEIAHRGVPFRYLLSGGVSTWLSAPEWSFGPAKWAEGLLTARTRVLDMFAMIVVTRTSD